MRYLLENVSLVSKMLWVWKPDCYTNPKWIYPAKNVYADIHQIIQIFGQYWSHLNTGECYAWSYRKTLSFAFGRKEEDTVLGDIEAGLTRNLCECICTIIYNINGEICGIPEKCLQIPEKCLPYS